MNRLSLSEVLSVVLPAAALLVAIAFVYGVLVGKYRYFPYDVLNQAIDAGRAIRTVYFSDPPFYHSANYSRPGATIYDTQRTYPGLTFMTGFRNKQFQGFLIDMQGRVLHEWNAAFSDVWPRAPHLHYQLEDQRIAWHGFHLFPNGDLLFNFDMTNFPPGSGLVKIDKDSNILWKLGENTHHDVSVGEDGVIYVLGQTFHTEPGPNIKDYALNTLDDLILVISKDGRIVDRISLVEAIKNSSYHALLKIGYASWMDGDLLHANSVEPLPEDYADAFPQFDAGDLLVSLRHINTIAVIDRERKIMKWALTGKTAFQHDGDWLPNGHIMIFDNLGNVGVGGGSRIVEIDPVSGNIVWHYAGTEERMFHNQRAGNQQALPNGNVLVTDSESGRAFEVARDGTIVWEYFNAITRDGYEGDSKKWVGMITEAIRYSADDLPFLKKD